MIKLCSIPVIGCMAILTIIATRNVRSRLAYRYSVVVALNTTATGCAVVHFHRLIPSFCRMTARTVVGRQDMVGWFNRGCHPA